MFRCKTTVESLLAAIRKHCKECNGGEPRTCEEEKCPLYGYRTYKKVQADQTHLFCENDRDMFYAHCDRSTAHCTSIDANVLRRCVSLKSLKPNWIGGWFHTLKGKGWKAVELTSALHSEANGRRVFVWRKTS